jgi:hypothetical protein
MSEIAMGKVVFHPDQRVCDADSAGVREVSGNGGAYVKRSSGFGITTWSYQSTRSRGRELVWKIPTQSLVRDLLCNPFYAGAYVWGRRPVATVLAEGRLEKRQGATRRAEDCRVFIPDHHVGYIDWATYEENQR